MFSITPASSGATPIPDWNGRRFTRAADEDTGIPFRHIIDEARNGQVTGVEYGSENRYLFEMYSVYGAFGQLEPTNRVSADYLWGLDTDTYTDILGEAGVMERSGDRL